MSDAAQPKGIFIHVDSRILGESGTSSESLYRHLELIWRLPGPRVLVELILRGVRSTGAIRDIAEVASILGVLEGKAGLNDVLEQIRTSERCSLRQPESSWFQLLLGYLVSSACPDVGFEQKAGGNPKDIIACGGKLHVECKSFVYGADLHDVWREQFESFIAIKGAHPEGKWHVRIDRNMDDGRPLKELVEIFKARSRQQLLEYPPGERGFTFSPNAEIETSGAWQDGHVRAFGLSLIEHVSDTILRPGGLFTDDKLSMIFSGPLVDQTNRFESALMDKMRQMVPGICNIFGVDIDDFTGDVDALKARLERFFALGRGAMLSGFLLVRRSSMTPGNFVDVEVLSNPSAGMPIPEAFVAKMRGRQKLGG